MSIVLSPVTLLTYTLMYMLCAGLGMSMPLAWALLLGTLMYLLRVWLSTLLHEHNVRARLQDEVRREAELPARRKRRFAAYCQWADAQRAPAAPRAPRPEFTDGMERLPPVPSAAPPLPVSSDAPRRQSLPDHRH